METNRDDGNHQLGYLRNHTVRCGHSLVLRVSWSRIETKGILGQTTLIIKLLFSPLFLKVISAHLIQNWKVEVHDLGFSKEMQVKYSCAYLPNKVGTCPNRTFFTSPESDPIKFKLVNNFVPLLDFGSKQLEKMESLQKTGFISCKRNILTTFFFQPVNCIDGLVAKFFLAETWSNEINGKYQFR